MCCWEMKFCREFIWYGGMRSAIMQGRSLAPRWVMQVNELYDGDSEHEVFCNVVGGSAYDEGTV